MITANRFDQIKKLIEARRASPSFTDDAVGELVQALAELAAEIDRIRQVPTVRNSGQVRPLVLGADGRPVVGPPLAQQFAAERRQQYDEDRQEALGDELPDPAKWRRFALRWGLAPPPGGWDNVPLIVTMMHRLRLEVDSVPHILKHASAVHLKANGIALPHGFTITDGVLNVPPPQSKP